MHTSLFLVSLSAAELKRKERKNYSTNPLHTKCERMKKKKSNSIELEKVYNRFLFSLLLLLESNKRRSPYVTRSDLYIINVM